MSDLHLEWCLFNICWNHTQLCHCYFTIWQGLGWPCNQMLKSQIRVSVRKTQRLQTQANWKSQWNVQQSRSPIAFEFQIVTLFSSHKLDRYHNANKLGHKVRQKIYVKPDNLFSYRICDPIKVTQLTNVTTQYGMTSTQNAYMWMFGFAGEGKGFLDWIFFHASNNPISNLVPLSVRTLSKP